MNKSTHLTWKPRLKREPKLTQNEIGEWFIDLGSGNPLPASDAEVVLWQALQEARRMIKQLSAEVRNV